MGKERNKFYINWKECELKFIKLIPTWWKGSYIEGEYELICESKIIHLGLQLPESLCSSKGLREPSEEEAQEGFRRNKEDQERFFKEEGKKLVEKGLIARGEIETIKQGCKIPAPNSTVKIKSIKKKNQVE